MFEDYRGLILRHKVVNPGGRGNLSLLCELGGDSSQRKHGLRDSTGLILPSVQLHQTTLYVRITAQSLCTKPHALCFMSDSKG